MVNAVLDDIDANNARPPEQRRIGASRARQITDALRREGLLVLSEQERRDERMRRLVEVDRAEKVCRCPILKVGDYCPVHGG